MKFFSIDRIKKASTHLENFHSGWVLVPLVLAANGVNSKSFTDLQKENGTDTFLDDYFNGGLIGLNEGRPANALRPRFKDLLGTFRKEGRAKDYAINQKTKLWANAYSSRGYREMQNRGELETKGSSVYHLAPSFQPAFEANLPDTFRFEELLVWLYAFRGVPDDINSWQALSSHFQAEVRGPGNSFPPEYLGRFKIDNPSPVPWPTDFTASRPSNDAFQNELLPSLKGKKDSYTPGLSDDDEVLQHVLDLIENRGERNFLFYGPPGTGKTMYAHAIAEHLASGDKARWTKLQFHPSLSYDDFVEGYVPELSETSGTLQYRLLPRHFVEFCGAAEKAPPDTYYVMVIDEVSRGDPSRVFGDMLTYIDKDYRGEEFVLSYSKEPFSVPDNVIIIGTTNPYDRSVAELDDAILRRFSMIEFPPNRAALDKHFAEAEIVGDYPQKVAHLFDILNDALPNGFGHAYFFRIEGPDQFMKEWRGKLRFIVARALQFDRDRLTQIDAAVDKLFPEKKDAEQAAEPQAEAEPQPPPDQGGAAA